VPFRRLLIAFSVSGLLATLASAHHSNVIFDMDSTITLQATVTRYDWRNPHVYLYVTTQNNLGEHVEWQIEADPTPIMVRSGWSRDTLAAGDRITVRVHPDKTQPEGHGLLVSLLQGDGELLGMRTGGRSSTVAADGFEGVWDGLRGMRERTFIYGELTGKGRRAQEQYDESMSDVLDCVPFPTPTVVSAPYLYEVEILEDRIVLRTELFHTERTFFTDGRGHPANVGRTNQGHSIGHWEGDVLVVDTVGFADSRNGNRNGVPGGAQKHTVERFWLSEDRTRMMVEYWIDDPEYMVEPMHGEMFWDYAPDREFLPFDCDPDNARLYSVQ
jgi:hypothetical protein